jgi:hypothetical protein
MYFCNDNFNRLTFNIRSSVEVCFDGKAVFARLNQLILKLILILFVQFFICSNCYSDGIGDCLWGGSNEETAYTVPFVQSGTTLTQANRPPMNIGAPAPSIPIQATPSTRATIVPQANVPTVSPVTGSVGSVGQPATSVITSQPVQFNYQGSSRTAGNVSESGVEILYVIPSDNKASEVYIDGDLNRAAALSNVVPSGTPGAIPVQVKTVTAYKPRLSYKLRFTPIIQKKETLVNVFDPRTKRIIKRYYQTQEQQITNAPILHWEEIIDYESVTVKMGIPIKQNYPQNYSSGVLSNSNPVQVSPPVSSTTHKVLYLDPTSNQSSQPINQPQSFTTDIY